MGTNEAPAALQSPETRRRPKRRWLLAVTVLAALAAGAYFVAAHWLGQFLESRDVRSLVTRKTGKELGAPTGYLPLQWRGVSVYSDGMLAQAPAERSLSEVRARQLWARCDFLRLYRGQMQIERLTIDRLQAAFGKPAAARLIDDLPATPALEPPAEKDSAIGLDIREVIITHTDLHWGKTASAAGAFRDVMTRYYPVDKNLRVLGEGGTFKQTNWPEARVRSFQLFYAKPSLQIEEGTLALGGKSTIGVTGSFDLGERSGMDLKLAFRECDVSPFLRGAMREKFDAGFEAQVRLQQQFKSEQPLLVASGDVTFSGAVLQNVAALERIAAFTGREEFRRLNLQRLTGTFQWEKPRLAVDDFVLEARGLVRIEGTLTVRGESIDGRLKLGASAELLESFPGAREEVFTEARGGYFWTPVRLTGPVKKPNDDLKPRLVAAARAHFARKFLAPLLKPGEAVIDALERL